MIFNSSPPLHSIENRSLKPFVNILLEQANRRIVRKVLQDLVTEPFAPCDAKKWKLATLFGMKEGERILSNNHPVVRHRAGRSESSLYFPDFQEERTVLNVLEPGPDKNFHQLLGPCRSVAFFHRSGCLWSVCL
jgi:hypothetical protein